MLKCHLACVDILLSQSGINLNVRSDNGQTIVSEAVQRGQLSAAKFLIEKGADVTIPDMNGLTPLHYLVKHNKTADAIEVRLQLMDRIIIDLSE